MTKAATKSRLRVFRFNMIEIALALVILAVGLSSVLILFPIGANAGKSSVTDSNLANVAEQVMATLQRHCSAPANWKRDGTGDTITAFDPDPQDSDVPQNDSGFTDAGAGLLKKDNQTYIYRQETAIPNDSGSDTRVVDFEVMIRVGLDTSTMTDQYYPLLVADGSSKWKTIGTYSRPSGVPASGTNLDTTGAGILSKCYKTLIVEFSWPIEAPWSNREKRIFRLEMFNENFVPYPQTNP